jgi:hypothetical protein
LKVKRVAHLQRAGALDDLVDEIIPDAALDEEAGWRLAYLTLIAEHEFDRHVGGHAKVRCVGEHDIGALTAELEGSRVLDSNSRRQS